MWMTILKPKSKENALTNFRKTQKSNNLLQSKRILKPK